LFFFFFFKQKTAYEIRIRDWSSDVCSSDLGSRDWVNWKGKPGKIEFTGTLLRDGTASVDGKGTVQGRDEFDVTLTGRTSETLTGPMLNDKQEPFRDCTLQLRSIGALLH